jgi:phosphoribosylglycinamide formyltransferase-1
LFKLVVLASGSGSNLQVIIDRLHGRVAGIEIVGVFSDILGVLALERAERADIPTAAYPLEDFPSREARDRTLADAVEAAGADLVVGAGFMQLLTPTFLERFPWRVINLHPALLPSFPGTRGVDDAFAYGVKLTGVTVHYMDAGMDTGPIIRQEALPVHDHDTPGALAMRVHALEHRVLPRVIELIAQGKVQPPPPGSRRVRVDDSEPSEIVT